MKIIYYSPHPHINMSAPSGPGTHIREVIHGFEQRGHTVVKLIAGGTELDQTSSSISYKKRSWKKLIPNFIWQTVKDYLLIRLDKKLEQQLAEMILSEKPDFVYERAYYLMGSGYKAAAFHSVKYACEINAPYPEEKSAMSGKSLFVRRAKKNETSQVQSSNRVFVVSTALKKYLEKSNDTSQSKIVVTPNAVNPKHIGTNSQTLKEIRNKTGIQPSDKVFGFVGSIFPYHGVDALIETFAQIRNERKESIKLLVVGDGEILSELKLRVKALGIENDAFFTGNIPHSMVYDYIDIMDFTVMARSNWYGSPVKIFEYGIMKKCIIAPDVVPVTDVMKDHEDGLLISDDIHSLKNALDYFLDHPSEAFRMAENFFEKVSKKYTWQQVSDRILEEMK